jgi:hypothetical protein
MPARPTSAVSLLATAAIAAAGLTASAPAVVVSQVDTFSAGTSGWQTGAANNPFTPSTGGPAGAGDAFLQLTSDGSGPSGRLIEFNRAQWLGDYITAGVNAVGVDLFNIGGTPLSMRIAFKDGTGPGAGGYASTVAFLLPNDGIWHHAIFNVADADMTPIGTPVAFSTFIRTPQEFRILHSAAPALNGDNIVGKLGVDNVTALPAPGTIACGGLVLMLAARRRR